MIETIKLDNGVTVVMSRMPYVRSISLGIYVKNGSKNETKETNGISHFIEHMLFKGTENRTAKDIAEELDGVGGQLNAYTTKEYTCYYTRTLDTHFDTAIDVLSDMYFNSLFNDEEIIKERNVIIEEINMYEDTPDDLVHEQLQRNIWRDNSLGMPILGTEESISKFTHGTFKKYMEENYTADNTIVAVAGNFECDDIVKRIEKYFGIWKSEKYKQKNNEQLIYIPSAVKSDKNIEQIHLCLAFPGVSVLSKDTYVLSALNTILGGGMSSRLFQKIREQSGMAYSVYSYNSNYTEGGLFSIYAGLNPSRLDNVVNMIYEEIDNLYKEKITVNVLEKTKEQIKSNYLMGQESTMNVLSGLGRTQLLLGKAVTPEKTIEKIDAVTIEDLYRVADIVLDKKCASISIVGKTQNVDCGKYVIR